MALQVGKCSISCRYARKRTHARHITIIVHEKLCMPQLRLRLRGSRGERLWTMLFKIGSCIAGTESLQNRNKKNDPRQPSCVVAQSCGSSVASGHKKELCLIESCSGAICIEHIRHPAERVSPVRSSIRVRGGISLSQYNTGGSVKQGEMMKIM